MILDPSHATPGTVQALPTHVPGVFSANALRDLFQKSPTKQKKIARTVESKPQHAAGHRRPTAHKQASDHNDSMQLRIWLQQRVPSSSIVHNELRSHAIRAALAVDSASASVDEHVRWIKNNVPLHSVPKGVISNRTKISSFVDVLRRILHARLLAAFSLWHDAVVSDKQAAAVAQFVRSEAVQSLQDIWERSWQRKRDRAFYMWHVEVRCGQTQELHAAAAEIQRWVKMFQRRHLLYAMRRTRAATQLQSNYRRHTTRKAFRRLVQAEAVRRAATTVQAAYRRKRSRRTFLNALLVYVQSQAAVVLQRWMRNTIYRMQWLRRRGRDVLAAEAATCIQRTVRAFLTRGWCRRIRQDKRAATIQRAWRQSRLHSRGPFYASIAHLALSIQLGVHAWHATVLQAAARGFIGRRCVTKRRLERRSAISLQRTWREYVARQRRTQTRQERRLRRLLAAHCIQATYRGYRDRVLFRLAMTKSCVPMYLRACRLQSMPLQLVFRERFHNSIVHSASSVIATVWRRYWRRKVSRHKELTAAAVVVQTIYRSQRTQRWFRKHVARIRRSATSIQRMVRSRLARNHTKQHIAAMKKVAQAAQTARSNQAALRVQAAWRKKKGRMALHLRRQAQELEMARRHASSKTIQRFVRHTRQRRQNCRNMVVAVAEITVKVAARHAAARRIQRKFRAYRSTRLGKAMLATLKLDRRKRERRLAKQKIISDFLVESAVDRENELALMAKVKSNHEKVQGEKDRKATEAAAAKAERRRLALFAAETNVRTPPPRFQITAPGNGKSEWVEAWDDVNNRKYLYNAKTGESKWA